MPVLGVQFMAIYKDRKWHRMRSLSLYVFDNCHGLLNWMIQQIKRFASSSYTRTFYYFTIKRVKLWAKRTNHPKTFQFINWKKTYNTILSTTDTHKHHKSTRHRLRHLRRRRRRHRQPPPSIPRHSYLNLNRRPQHHLNRLPRHQFHSRLSLSPPSLLPYSPVQHWVKKHLIATNQGLKLSAELRYPPDTVQVHAQTTNDHCLSCVVKALSVRPRYCLANRFCT